jgi:thymidylate kinase
MMTKLDTVLEIQTEVREGAGALTAIAGLFKALNHNGIRYCHWKSNLRLEQALKAKTDLDLLIDRSQSLVFRQILLENDIKPVLAAKGRRYPGLEDYLGFDEASGKLFHLHVHYLLVLGEQFVKNYHLPLESHFLKSIRQRQGVKIPAPELELIILSIRALLKYRDRDVVKDIFRIRSPGLPVHILEEIDWLLDQTSIEKVAQCLEPISGVVPSGTVLEFLSTVSARPRAGYKFFQLRNQVRRSLRPFQRRDRLQASFLYFREVWNRRNSFLRFAPVRKMALTNGGVSLALIGIDGAGKSTMSHRIFDWLASKLDVNLYYLGSKQPSFQTRLFYILFRICRRSNRDLTRAMGKMNIFSNWLDSLKETFLYLHYYSTGRDRYQRIQAGKKNMVEGSIVVYDRYPLETISSRRDFRLLDGPQIQLAGGARRGILIGRIAGAEQSLYRQFQLPDRLIVLDIHPEVSMQRKPDHDRNQIEAKSQAINALLTVRDIDIQNLNMVSLNGEQPFQDVVSQLKKLVWEAL